MCNAWLKLTVVSMPVAIPCTYIYAYLIIIIYINYIIIQCNYTVIIIVACIITEEGHCSCRVAETIGPKMFSVSWYE